jgi:hypothetical protein
MFDKFFMKQIYLLSLGLLLSLSASSQFLISKTFLRSYTKAELDSTLNAIGIPAAVVGTKWGVDTYKVLYNTVSWDSSATYASGLLIVPKLQGCTFPIAVYSHGTMTYKEDAPSRLNGSEPYIGLIMSSFGYVAVLPDYLGLGDGPGLHPYQHKQTEATCIVDIIRAAKEALPDLGVSQNNQLFLTGYSQGGHATMAAQELIQNQLGSEMTVTASAPLSGAYSMSGVMVDLLLSDNPYPEPAYLPYIVFGWNQIYHFFDNPSEILASPWDTLLPPLYDGTHNFGEINSTAPIVPKTIFKQTQIDSFINDSNYFFRVALRANDSYKFVPTAPTYMMYCRGDSRVPFQNAVTAIEYFNANGCQNCDTLDVNPALDHMDCAQYAVLNVKQFFEGFAIHDSCEAMSYAELIGGWDIGIDWVNQNLVVNIASTTLLPTLLELYNVAGEKVGTFQLQNKENQQFSIENLPAGMYVAQVSGSNKTYKVKKFILAK